MRIALIFALVLARICTSAQDRILINEVLPGNQGVVADSAGRTPDWIELYNPSSKAVDLNGWRLAIAGRQHVFTTALRVPAKSYRMLWCDGRENDGADHIAFALAREGGALLLIAPDGITIADVFSYPVMLANVSIGRLPDGARSWSYFTEPTPAARNHSDDGGVRLKCEMPSASHASGSYDHAFDVELLCTAGASIRYTLDGTWPTKESGELYASPVPITRNTTLHAIAFALGHLASEVSSSTFLIDAPVVGGIALSLEPEDLWSDSTGIYGTGAFNNNTRRGKDWERSGVAEWFGDTTLNVGVRIGGSGSRGARKRSFKLYAHGGADFQFADGTMVDEGMLRADAGAHTFLRNMLVEDLVRRFHLNLDVQPSTPSTLYLNAANWGLYRWMPAKNAAWLRTVSGAEALDVLEGPASVALNGNDRHFMHAQDLLMHNAPLDSIEALIDVKSLIDLACIDLWTGRADHDLNVRCYRPRQTGGRWRWVLFDMDLWAPAEENSVERMCSAAAPETPFIPQLLAHRELQEQLFARITALQATAFVAAPLVADSIHHANEVALLSDFRRWELELDMPHPDSTLASVKRFASARPDDVFAHLARRTGRKLRIVTIEVPPTEQGQLKLDGLPLPQGRQQVRCFSGVPIQIEAEAASGYEFAGWKGVNLDAAKGEIDLARSRNVRAVFRPLVP